MKLEEFKVYQMSMEVGEEVWDLVKEWDYFSKDTVGKQLVRSIDSVAANLSEGYGRYHFNEAKHFSYYARGSLFESKTWLLKAHKRGLISKAEYDKLIKEMETIGIKLNNFINSIGKK
jgi:four helix bundle protein